MARTKNAKYKKPDLIRMILEWTGQGYSQKTIIDNLMNLGYKIDYCYQLLRDAKPLIQETFKEISKEKLESVLIEMEAMKQEAQIAEDRNLVLQIQKEINKIIGLGTTKVDLTTNGESINKIEVIKIIEVKKDETI